mmetsp:Transcript_62313/g.103627  ORF Transcript_62313/g.103627 Transcript_62313/m.103627 type:complete len:301 (+) Transcript_62313:239-1141(+)
MSAPRSPPAELLAAYTLGGRVKFDHFYVDEAAPFPGGGAQFGRAYIDDCIKHASVSEHLQVRSWVASGVARNLVAFALAAGGPAAVHGRDVVVFGATEPWVECLVLAQGGASVTTIEYKTVTYEHPKLRMMNVSEFEASVYGGKGSLAASFDVAIALSAFDHDGLGRYGDRLHPDGDMLAMRTAWRALRPGNGRLLLSVPIGPDRLVWNLHRRYGQLRLPRMLAGWEEVARLGWDEKRISDEAADHRRRFEPLFILARNSTLDLNLPSSWAAWRSNMENPECNTVSSTQDASLLPIPHVT